MSQDLRVQIENYIAALFVEDDPVLAHNAREATTAGLPPIQVSPNQGRLLYLLTKMSGARRVLEIGTLGGYSTTWLARALPEGGRVTSLELDPGHAQIARTCVDRAGIGARVTIEVGPADETLRRLIAQRIEPFDLIFIDADKPNNPGYLSLQLSRSGTVILADNLIRDGAVLDAGSEDDNARAARAFNATLAAHPRLESIIIPVLGKKVDGMSISVVR